MQDYVFTGPVLYFDAGRFFSAVFLSVLFCLKKNCARARQICIVEIVEQY
jgi:hypothetical protein